MTFDPFDDFETRGYLRNVAGQKDPDIIKRLEHNSFLTGVDEAFENLARIERLTYRDVLATHKTLFEAVYPWAGQDRAQSAPDKAVSRGSVFFAHPNDIKAAVDHALNMGQVRALMAAKAGEVMGYLAYGHPFLDGNGRTIMVVHTELAQQAGFSIDWAATDKAAYLTALTKELERPGKGILDAYLKPHVRPAIGRERLASHVAGLSGIDGNPGEPASVNEVLGTFSDPALQARYRHQQQQRGESGHSESRELPATAQTLSPAEQAIPAAGSSARDSADNAPALEPPSGRPPRGRGGRG